MCRFLVTGLCIFVASFVVAFAFAAPPIAEAYVQQEAAAVAGPPLPHLDLSGEPATQVRVFEGVIEFPLAYAAYTGVPHSVRFPTRIVGVLDAAPPGDNAAASGIAATRWYMCTTRNPDACLWKYGIPLEVRQRRTASTIEFMGEFGSFGDLARFTIQCERPWCE